MVGIVLDGGVNISPAPIFYTTEEVAELLKISAKTVREMIKDKRLQAVRVGKEYRITEDQIRQYVDENKT